MNRFLVLAMLFGARINCGEPATQGAICEALFIVGNKQREVLEYIQEFKKELTHSYITKPNQRRTRKEGELEQYHARLKRTLYPKYIDELELHVKKIVGYSAQCATEDPSMPSEDFIKSTVDYSFLLKDKVAYEAQFLQALFSLDESKCARDVKTGLVLRKQRMSRNLQRTYLPQSHEKKLKKIIGEIDELKRQLVHLQQVILDHKKELANIKKKLDPINHELYTRFPEAARVYMHRLNSFK
jgi:hypothetical protein